MNSRRSFLNGLFRSLEADGLPYCVLRNYEGIFTDATSDVDLILEKGDLGRFAKILHAAAGVSGHRFIHSARYGNYSHVFWSDQREFVRIDFETEARWRVFPILSAKSILALKQKRDTFYVPHPRHESVILFLQAIWRGSLSTRYCERLSRLYEVCEDKVELRQTYREAFGSFGRELADFHARITTAGFDAAFCSRLRRSIVSKTLTRPASLGALATHACEDARRLWERLRQPAGISLLFASSAAGGKNFDELMRRIEFLFPAQKCFIQTINLSHLAGVPQKLEKGLKVRRLRTLFKGGLFVRHYQIARDADLRKIIKTHPQHLYPSRSFICMEDSRQKMYLAHAGSGFMADSSTEGIGGNEDVSAILIDFIAAILEKQKKVLPAADRERGKFAVLIGLDGSGKTTLARNLCQLTAAGTRFDGVSYCHWRPKFLNRNEFPWPDFEETPRKKLLPKTWLNALLSSLRLSKNVLLANLAGRWRLRLLTRRNHLVLIDRYFYNYHLDPDSVKYAGPAWLLKWLLPLFPKPDVMLTLNADAETLLARKRELSPEEIGRQVSIQKNLDFQETPCVALDAREPAWRVAEIALVAITVNSSNRTQSDLACSDAGLR